MPSLKSNWQRFLLFLFPTGLATDSVVWQTGMAATRR